MKLTEAIKILKSNNFIVEAVNINKDYLQKLAAQYKLDFNQTKLITNNFIRELQQGITIPQNIKDKFANILTCINIKAELNFINDELLHKLHDGILNNSNLITLILQKANSDTTPEHFSSIVDELVHKVKSVYKLSSEDLAIWERVKVYKDFGNYRWVYAVDETGHIVGYLPSRITAVTMNHCGNEPSNVIGDEYWELRDNSNKAYLTVILNKGLIQEAKSYGNKTSMFVKEIYKYVEWFYKSNIVKGVGNKYDYGYATDKNFGASTIASVDPEFITWCKENKPALLGEPEKAIIKFRNYSVDELTEMFIDDPSKFGKNNWSIYLAAIGGKEKLPLSEDDIIHKLIEPKKLSLSNFSNADVELLTQRIQRAYVKFYGINALTGLFDIAKQVNSFNIDYNIIQFLFTKNQFKANMLMHMLPERKQKLYKDFI